MLSLSQMLEEAFSKNRISVDGIDDTFNKFVGVIDSLKEVHEEKFSTFADLI